GREPRPDCECRARDECGCEQRAANQKASALAPLRTRIEGNVGPGGIADEAAANDIAGALPKRRRGMRRLHFELQSSAPAPPPVVIIVLYTTITLPVATRSYASDLSAKSP